jgi:hypothetical protein
MSTVERCPSGRHPNLYPGSGFDVVLAADDDAVQDVAADLDDRGCEVSAVQVDLSTHDGVEELNRRVALGGPLRIAALNAKVLPDPLAAAVAARQTKPGSGT